MKSLWQDRLLEFAYRMLAAAIVLNVTAGLTHPIFSAGARLTPELIGSQAFYLVLAIECLRPDSTLKGKLWLQACCRLGFVVFGPCRFMLRPDPLWRVLGGIVDGASAIAGITFVLAAILNRARLLRQLKGTWTHWRIRPWRLEVALAFYYITVYVLDSVRAVRWGWGSAPGQLWASQPWEISWKAEVVFHTALRFSVQVPVVFLLLDGRPRALKMAIVLTALILMIESLSDSVNLLDPQGFASLVSRLPSSADTVALICLVLLFLTRSRRPQGYGLEREA